MYAIGLHQHCSFQFLSQKIHLFSLRKHLKTTPPNRETSSSIFPRPSAHKSPLHFRYYTHLIHRSSNEQGSSFENPRQRDLARIIPTTRGEKKLSGLSVPRCVVVAPALFPVNTPEDKRAKNIYNSADRGCKIKGRGKNCLQGYTYASSYAGLLYAGTKTLAPNMRVVRKPVKSMLVISKLILLKMRRRLCALFSLFLRF